MSKILAAVRNECLDRKEHQRQEHVQEPENSVLKSILTRGCMMYVPFMYSSFNGIDTLFVDIE